MRSIEAEAKREAARPRSEADQAAKRATWSALNQHFPDLIPDVHTLGERFGISGVTVQAGGETVAWGDTRGHEV